MNASEVARGCTPSSDFGMGYLSPLGSICISVLSFSVPAAASPSLFQMNGPSNVGIDLRVSQQFIQAFPKSTFHCQPPLCDSASQRHCRQRTCGLGSNTTQ